MNVEKLTFETYSEWKLPFGWAFYRLCDPIGTFAVR